MATLAERSELRLRLDSSVARRGKYDEVLLLFLSHDNVRLAATMS